MEEEVERIHRPVRELESAVLYEVQSDEQLSSVDIKYGEYGGMPQMVATAIRDCLSTDAALINAGAVRGNKHYTECISYGDLKKECPYPSPMVAVQMPYSVFRDAVQLSRRPWLSGERKEVNSALIGDFGVEIGRQDHMPTSIGGDPPEADRLYTVACDCRVLKKNEVFSRYCREFPERVPPE